jgi:hypothetical protein
MDHLRIEPREMIMYRVGISWEDENGGLKTYDGMLEDKSRSGAGIFVRDAIPAGTRVKVREKNQERVGTVRHCRADQTGFFIGIKYDAPDA